MVDHERDEDRDEPTFSDDEPTPSGDEPEAVDGDLEAADGDLDAAAEDEAAETGDRPARQALYVALAALVLAGVALVAPWISGGPDRVEARSVAVVDGDGRTRAVLDANDAGRVSLRLLEPSGEVAATLEAGDTSPELNLQGREGQARLGLSDVIENGGGLSFYDAGDRLRVGLAFSPGVGSNMVLGDEAGNVGVQMALDSQGPFVTLRAPDGSVVWAVPEESAAQTEGGSE